MVGEAWSSGLRNGTTFGSAIEGWSLHVVRIGREMSAPPTLERWSADDYVAALFLRDRVENALEQVWNRDSQPAILETADSFFRSISEPIDSLLFLEWNAPTDRWWWKRVPKFGPIREDIDLVQVASRDASAMVGMHEQGHSDPDLRDRMSWLRARGFVASPGSDDSRVTFVRADGMTVLVNRSGRVPELAVGPPRASGQAFAARHWREVLENHGFRIRGNAVDDDFFESNWPSVAGAATYPDVVNELLSLSPDANRTE